MKRKWRCELLLRSHCFVCRLHLHRVRASISRDKYPQKPWWKAADLFTWGFCSESVYSDRAMRLFTTILGIPAYLLISFNHPGLAFKENLPVHVQKITKNHTQPNCPKIKARIGWYRFPAHRLAHTCHKTMEYHSKYNGHFRLFNQYNNIIYPLAI